MGSLFRVLFWIVIILASVAFYLHTSAGSGFIGKLFRYSGVERTERRIAEERSSRRTVREKNLMMKEIVDRKKDAFLERSLRQRVDLEDRIDDAQEQQRGEPVAPVANDASAVARKAREAQDKAYDDQEFMADGQRDHEAITARLGRIRERLDAAEARVDAGRERAIAQKERMDAKAAR